MAQFKSLHDLLSSFYGITTTSRINHLTDTVGTTVTKVCNSNPKRVYLTITNLGTSDVYFFIDNSVSTTKGIYISPNGGSITLKWLEDFDLLEHEFYAIAVGASSKIMVLEGVIL